MSSIRQVDTLDSDVGPGGSMLGSEIRRSEPGSISGYPAQSHLVELSEAPSIAQIPLLQPNKALGETRIPAQASIAGEFVDITIAEVAGSEHMAGRIGQERDHQAQSKLILWLQSMSIFSRTLQR